MVTEGPAQVLHGRRVEREALERLLAEVRGGESRVLVVSGDPGVGKTALLESAISSASGFRVMRAVGVEAEMELAFAALQQLFAPMLDRLDRLPGPQGEALGVAFGLRAGHAPDRFLVGLAVLSLLAEMAEERPLVCVVDDAQWLDRASAQALVFVARRLLAESIALVLVTRDPGEELRGFQELVVEGLRDGDARALLSSAVGVPLDERVQERIVAETRGNPLALLELPRGLTPAQLAGGFGLPGAMALSRRIEESFRSRLATLPADTRWFLVVAAADPVGDPVLVWGAARRLGVGAEAANAAEAEGLLSIGGTVQFRHPLVRSATYQAASAEQRRRAHGALADATDPAIDPDRRAWHRARAAPGPDEDIAAELERSAGRAQRRGGVAAAAAFLERATELTADPARRARRALAAARAKHEAGALDAAYSLVAIAEAGPLVELERARVDALRAQIAFAARRGSDAAPLFIKAAKRLEPLDVRLARDTYLDALAAGVFGGQMVSGGGVREVAKAVLAAPPAPPPPRAFDLLLDGLAQVICEGHGKGAPRLKQALRLLRDDEASAEEGVRWLWLAGRAGGWTWDHESWDVLSARQISLARASGALIILPIALSIRAGARLLAGDLVAAASLVQEVVMFTEATGSRIVPYAALVLAAFRGRESEASELIEAGIEEFRAGGEDLGLKGARWAAALLYNGLGRYEQALAAAQQAGDDPREPWFAAWGWVELIEAASRTGASELAARSLERLSETTRASGSDWALGVEARSRALLTEGEAAEPLYCEAIEALGRTRVRVELARAHLLYGEWLRRRRRRLDARKQLRTAHTSFTEFGMEGFAERARVELEATGERARKRTVETSDDLTPQEAQISRLAADGATNQEIAAQLFISPSTVDYHLRKAFRKLGVRSRHQLEQHLLQPHAHSQ